MKKVSLVVALVGMISAASFGSSNKVTNYLQEGPKKEAPKAQPATQTQEAPKPQKAEPATKAQPVAVPAKEKPAETKPEGTKKGSHKKHSKAKSHSVKNDGPKQKVSETPKEKK